MILKRLVIDLQEWGDDKGKYTGYVSFSDSDGEIKLNLTPEHCDKIFLICVDGVLSTAKEAAEKLTCAVIEHQKKLTVDEE